MGRQISIVRQRCKVEIYTDTMADLKAVFSQFAGADGSLNAKSVKRALKALGVSKDLNADDILDKMDANKDGTIDLEEWDKHMVPELKAAIQAQLDDAGLVKGFRPLVDIAKVFDQLDTDKSGDLSKEEIDDALKTMDENSDGVVSIEEFKNGLPKEVLQAMSAALDAKGLITGV